MRSRSGRTSGAVQRRHAIEARLVSIRQTPLGPIPVNTMLHKPARSAYLNIGWQTWAEL